MAEIGEALSDRELDVLRCISSGASNKETASELSISQNTVKVHLRNIYTKLGVSSRTEATTEAIKLGILIVPSQETEPVPGAITLAGEGADGMPAPTAAGAVAPSPETGAAPAGWQRWRIPALILLLLLSGATILFLVLQVRSQNVANATPEPFEDLPLGETRWFSSRPMPDARAHMAVAAVGLDLYQIGGETPQGIDGEVWVFDSLNRAWRQASDKPTPVADSSAAELYGELYVVGGRLADGQITAAVEAYSPSVDAWRPVAALPRPVAGGLALSDGAFLYFFGGWDGERYLDTAYVYDPSADSWRPLPEMPEARAYAAGGLLPGKLIVAGGTDGEQETASCQLFDPSLAEWSMCPDMLMPRGGAGATVVLNKLYVIGGGLQEGRDIPFGEVYDPNTETWQVVNLPAADKTGGWPHLGVSHVETRIYALGGRQDGQLLDNTLVYAPLVYQTYIPAASSGGEE